MEKILHFLTVYNAQIIEVVIAIILLLGVVWAFRLLVSPKHSVSESESSAGLASGEIEKTLQKILENQANRPTMVEGVGASADPAAIDAAIAAKTEAMQKTVAEKEAQIQALQAKVQEAEKNASAAAQDAAAAKASGGSANTADLEGKIKDLEARLQEYEIIAEDISDLVRFREENDRLRKELEALKASATAAPPAQAAAAPAAAAPTPPPPAPAAEPVAAPVVESAPAAPETPAAAPAEVAAAAAPQAAAPATEGSAESFGIDDDLMKEFAAAVEGQKSGSLATGETAEPPKGDANDGLMDQFKDFVNKKN